MTLWMMEASPEGPASASSEDVAGAIAEANDEALALLPREERDRYEQMAEAALRAAGYHPHWERPTW